MEIKNAVITKATLTTEEHGLLTARINLDYGNNEFQLFGGYVLYLPKSYTHHKLMSFAGHFIYRIMEVAGATKWSDLPGKTIRVKADFSRVEAIGHILNDDWFNPEKDLIK